MNKNEFQECTLGASDCGVKAIGARKAVTLEISHAFDLMSLRATAMHLVANGNDKAAGIVRQISSKLEELQVRVDSLSGIRVDQGRVVALKTNQDQSVHRPGQETSPPDWAEQAQTPC